MYKVLAADDEYFIREGLKHLIEWNKLGFELVGICADGKELLEQVQIVKPDLLIIDIKMPNITGLEVAKYIYENKKDIEVILLSAFTEFTYAKQAIEYRVRKYIVKSMLLEELPKELLEVKEFLDIKNKDLIENKENLEEDEMIFKIKKFISENYANNISLGDIAKFVYSSDSYISRIFKQKTGENLFDYINFYRIEKAKEYIEKNKNKIYEISSLVGFCDTSYFSRVFKRYVGVSPKEYEKKIRLENE